MFESLFSKKTGSIEYIIVGLGNPGGEYRETRHNTGFIAVDYIAEKCNTTINHMKFKGMTADVVLNGKKTLLLKPATYMNLSGESVRLAMAYYKVPAEKVILLFDDISLDVGTIRIRLKGSHGGQNGMRSIIAQCGTDLFPRIKIGIGKKPNEHWDLADWVLSKFTDSDKKALKVAVEHAYQAACLMVEEKTTEAMNQFNG